VRWLAADHPLSFDELWILAGSTGYGSNFLDLQTNLLEPNPICTTSVEHSQSPWVVWTQGVTFHPPLHMVSLWGWRQLFGGSDFVAALFSGVCSVVAIGFLFAALRWQAGVGPATCASLCLTLSTVQTQIGTEIRGYGLLLALVGCAAWQMVRIETLGPTRRRVWLLGLTTLPLMLTHYFAAATCLAICGWALLRLPRCHRGPFAGAVVVAAGVYLAVWSPVALAHLNRTATIDMYKSGEPFLRGAARSGLALPVKLLFEVAPARQREWSLVLGISWLLLVVGLWRSSRVTVWALLLTLPIGMIMALDAARGTNQAGLARYSAAASLAAAVIPILSAFEVRNELGWIVGTTWIGLAVAGLGGPRNVGSPSFHHMSQALWPILQEESPTIPLVCRDTPGPYGFYGRAMLMEWLHLPGFVPRPLLVVQEAVPADALRALAAATPEHRFWLCVSSSSGSRVDLPESLRKLFPSARLVRAPVHVPAGRAGIQPEPAVDLWLLELDDAPLVPANANPQ
jgi:hypothetical protein